MTKKEPTGKFSRWIIDLQENDYEIIHKPGHKNANANAISRIDYDQMNLTNEQKHDQVKKVTFAQNLESEIMLESTNEENKNQDLSKQNFLGCTRINNKINATSGNESFCLNVCEDHNLIDKLTKEHTMYTKVSFEYEDPPVVSLTDNEPDFNDVTSEQRECSDFKDIINYLEIEFHLKIKLMLYQQKQIINMLCAMVLCITYLKPNQRMKKMNQFTLIK